MNPLLLAILGGPVAIAGPVLVARALVHGHADRTAADIATIADAIPAEPVRRTKELTTR